MTKKQQLEDDERVFFFGRIDFERNRSKRLYEAVKRFMDECANPAPDLLYRRTLRLQLEVAIANYEQNE